MVTDQPQRHHDVAPSISEMNAISYTAQQEWETEWNQQGLASRLTPEVKHIWMALCEKVPNALSQCHPKRRMGAHGRAHPPFGMTPTF